MERADTGVLVVPLWKKGKANFGEYMILVVRGYYKTRKKPVIRRF